MRTFRIQYTRTSYSGTRSHTEFIVKFYFDFRSVLDLAEDVAVLDYNSYEEELCNPSWALLSKAGFILRTFGDQYAALRHAAFRQQKIYLPKYHSVGKDFKYPRTDDL